MFKVTKELIKQRKPFCTMPIEAVKVKKMSGGIANDCYNNAYALRQKDENFFMVSGWVVLPKKMNDSHVKVVQHWFNIDLRTRKYCDTSPVENGAEYVADMSLYEYCTAHNDNLRTHVALSLIYEDERFKSVRQHDAENQIVSEIDRLSTDNLYQYSRIN